MVGCAKDESGSVPAAATQAPPHKRPRRLQSVGLNDVSFGIGASGARLWAASDVSGRCVAKHLLKSRL